MSQKSKDTGPAQHPAEALLRSVRTDHAPTSADRERVRRALARRLTQNADAPAPAPEMSALPNTTAVSPWLKPGLGLLLAVGAALAIQRYSTALPPAAVSSDALPPTAASTEARAPLTNPGIDTVEPNAPTPTSASAPMASARPTRERNQLAAGARTPRQPTPRDVVSLRREGKTQNAIPALAHDPTPSAQDKSDTHAQSHSSAGAADADREHLESQIASDNERGPRAAEPGEASGQAARERRVTDQPPLPAAEQRALAAQAKPANSSPAKPASEELAFVKRIKAALHAGEPQEVLELSQEHERRWPQGTFVQEREGLRAIAACQAHTPNAVSGANKFAVAYPRSPMLSRVHAACTPPPAAKSAH